MALIISFTMMAKIMSESFEREKRKFAIKKIEKTKK